MKVGIVSTSYPCSINPVSGIFVYRLVESLRKQIDIELLYPCSTKANMDNSQCFRYAPEKLQILAHTPGGIPVVLKNNHFAYLLLPFFIFSFLFATIKLSLRVNILHANWSIVGIICGIAGKLTNTPVITTIRGADAAKLQTSKWTRLQLKAAIYLSKNLVTVSETLKQNLQDYFPRHQEKIIHIPNGTNQIFYDLPVSTQIDINNINIAIIGSLIPRKNILTILKGVNEIKAHRLTLHIIGDGPDSDMLEKYVSKHQSSHTCIFYGQQNQQKITEILENTHIYIISSFSEGRANSLLEAMASGKAIIASQIPANCELIQDGINGFIFPAEDYMKLSKIMTEFINRPDLMIKFGHEARKSMIKKKLTWQNSSSRYISLYNEVVK